MRSNPSILTLRNLELMVKQPGDDKFRRRAKKPVYKLEDFDFDFVNRIRVELPIPEIEGMAMHEGQGQKDAKKVPEKVEQAVPIPLINPGDDNDEYKRKGGFRLTVSWLRSYQLDPFILQVQL